MQEEATKKLLEENTRPYIDGEPTAEINLYDQSYSNLAGRLKEIIPILKDKIKK
jgi:hypothetical protein